jgi:DNA repair ATPase RecN
MGRGGLEMLEKNDLLALGQMMDDLLDRKLEPINARLDAIEGRLDAVDVRLDNIEGRLDAVDVRLDNIEVRLTNLEENSKITRESVNTLLEWAEEAQVEVQIPLFKRAE